jgi:hypothetical protein
MPCRTRASSPGVDDRREVARRGPQGSPRRHHSWPIAWITSSALGVSPASSIARSAARKGAPVGLTWSPSMVDATPIQYTSMVRRRSALRRRGGVARPAGTSPARPRSRRPRSGSTQVVQRLGLGQHVAAFARERQAALEAGPCGRDAAPRSRGSSPDRRARASAQRPRARAAARRVRHDVRRRPPPDGRIEPVEHGFGLVVAPEVVQHLGHLPGGAARQRGVVARAPPRRVASWARRSARLRRPTRFSLDASATCSASAHRGRAVAARGCPPNVSIASACRRARRAAGPSARRRRAELVGLTARHAACSSGNVADPGRHTAGTARERSVASPRRSARR